MKRTTDEFIQAAMKIHGGKYDYSFVNYFRSHVKVSILCAHHGIFDQRPNDHLRGRGSACGGSNRICTIDFVKRAESIHGDVYDYTKTAYINMSTQVNISCHVHGDFQQWPSSHLYGAGCSKCSTAKAANKTRLTLDKFIEQANIAHGGGYDYSSVQYINARSKVAIQCRKHGVYYQIANDHLQGNKCPRCKGIISRPEDEWLDFVGLPKTPTHRQVSIRINGKRYTVDGFDPNQRVIYEFSGDFWHGNPQIYEATHINPISKKSYGDLHKATNDKLCTLRKANYTVIAIWETEWKQLKLEIRNVNDKPKNMQAG